MEITGTGTAVAAEIPVLHRGLQKGIRLGFRMEETAIDPAAAPAAAEPERQAVAVITEWLQMCHNKFEFCS